jgi:hypothetical protein
MSARGFIPSFPPLITDINVNTNDTIAANTHILIEFTKEIDQESFEQSFFLTSLYIVYH